MSLGLLPWKIKLFYYDTITASYAPGSLSNRLVRLQKDHFSTQHTYCIASIFLEDSHQYPHFLSSLSNMSTTVNKTTLPSLLVHSPTTTIMHMLLFTIHFHTIIHLNYGKHSMHHYKNTYL